MPIATATATRQGTTETNNADGLAVFTTADGITSAAVVDLIGHHHRAPQIATLLAETIVRVGAQRSGPSGLLSAGLLVANAGAAEEPEPDGVAVVAVADVETTVVSWTGDSHAYGWDGKQLRRYTTPHTFGEQLRANGAPWELAEKHDDWLKTTLGRATFATIFTITCPDPVVILASDGLDCVPHADLERICREHADAPQTLADALVAEPEADQHGYRDDVTVVVLLSA
jgi:serine/threonine protein phosphatase PrpC